MTFATSNTLQISHGQSILDEVLGQIATELTAQGEVEDNPLLRIANTHGSGFLSGSAAALLDSASVKYGQDRESDIISASVCAILAVISDRMGDAGLLDEERVDPDPGPWSKAGFDRGDSGDYFDDLLKKLSAAPPAQPAMTT